MVSLSPLSRLLGLLLVTALPTLALAQAAPESYSSLEAQIQRSTLSGGLKVALLSKPTTTQRTHGLLNLRFGDEHSLADKRFIADAVASTLALGTRTLSAQQLAERLQQLEGKLSVIADEDRIGILFSAPSAHLNDMFDLVVELLRHPTFPDVELSKWRNVVMPIIETKANYPATLAAEAMEAYNSAYPVGDIRRTLSSKETLAQLSKLKRQDLLDFHATFYGASSGELALVGNFDAAAILKHAEARLAGWHTPIAFKRPPRTISSAKPTTLQLESPTAENYYLARIRIPLKDDHRDAAALMLANHILGGGKSGGRLGEQLQAETNSALPINSQIGFSGFENIGNLTIHASPPQGQASRVAAVVRAELKNLARTTITQQTLQTAQAELLEKHKARLNDDAQIARQLPGLLRLNRTMNFLAQRDAAIQAASIEDIQAAAGQYFDTNDLIEIVVNETTKPPIK